jgi:putative chitinase
MITVKDLLAISGKRKGNAVTQQIADAFNKHAARFDVTTQKRISQFLANVSHETGGFTQLEENLNYSVSGLLKTFGRHRISKADAERLGRTSTRKANQKAIANILYGGEWGRKNLGNTQPNDGWDFRGSGPGQATGRANFQKVQDETGLPVVADPDLLRSAENGMIAALTLWQKWGLNELADSGQTDAIRRRWNGGTLGLQEVRDCYARARALDLSVPMVVEVAKPAPVPPPKPAHAPSPDAAGKVAATAAVGLAAAIAAWWSDISTWIGGLFQ